MLNTLYSVAEIRQTEEAAIADSSHANLMQRAGLAAAKLGMSLIVSPLNASKILVIAGPGNNGGDALECAALLAEAGASVHVLLYAGVGERSAECVQALQRARKAAVHFIDISSISDNIKLIRSAAWNLVVDGLFGIGLRRAISGDLGQVVEAINSIRLTSNVPGNCPILALDIPSGLNADTGNIVFEDSTEKSDVPHAIRANHTITFIGDKPGLHTASGRDFAGVVTVASLNIEDRFFPPSKVFLNYPALFVQCLQPRLHNSHKGSYGDLAVLGGGDGMAGAPILAARSALHCGAGRVFAVFCDAAPSYDSVQPELMCRNASDFDYAAATLVIGPGLGKSPRATEFLRQAIDIDTSIVLDADALNLIAGSNELADILSRRHAPTILTPHPLEAARLLGSPLAQIQANRPDIARQLAQRFNAIVILKGSGTIIARPDGRIVINTTGNPALATAGTGDVLAGLCGALLAQNWPAWETALAAVWVHGRAADRLIQNGVGPIGMTASELIPAIRSVLNNLPSELASKEQRILKPDAPRQS